MFQRSKIQPQWVSTVQMVLCGRLTVTLWQHLIDPVLKIKLNSLQANEDPSNVEAN